MNYTSYDGQFSPNDDFEIYICPSCGFTIRHKIPSTYRPNTICKCGYPDFVTQMIVINRQAIRKAKGE